MTIQEILRIKEKLGFSNEALSRMSGVPEETLQKMLDGTTIPGQKTIEALSRVLSEAAGESAGRTCSDTEDHQDLLRESSAYYQTSKKQRYSMKDIYALPEGVRAELIDGRLYFMGSPTRTHQRISGKLFLEVEKYIEVHNGSCEVYTAPFAVYPYGNEEMYVEPDLTVVCDLSKLEEKGCMGAPDWIVEILSPSTVRKDCGVKLFRYRMSGVREYWIIDPDKKIVLVYVFDAEHEEAAIYSFDDDVESSIFPGLKIRPSMLLWPEESSR